MKSFKNKWPAGRNSRNLLFFAQVLSELTDYHSWDNYRAYTLDTASRVEDLSNVSRRVDAEEVNKRYLQMVKDEASWSLSSDLIAKEVLKEDLDIYLKFLKDNNASLLDLEYRSDQIQENLLKNYQQCAENLILKTCKQDGKKFTTRKLLKQLTSCYCSFLLRKGYSQEYISQKLNEHFFTKDQKRYSDKQLKNFFKHFDSEDKSYRVFVKLQNKYCEFLEEYFGFNIVKLRELPACCRREPFFKRSPKKKVIDFGKTEALDPYKAGERVQILLQALKAFTWLEPIQFNLKWDKSMFVQRVGSTEVSKALKNQPSLKMRKQDILGGAERKYSIMVSKVFSDRCLVEGSRLKLIRSVDTFSQALDAKEADTQLVSMWASIEALMSDKKGSKVQHYDKYLLAAICDDYIFRNFEAAYKDLYIIYKDELNRVLKKNKTTRRDWVKSFYEVLLLDKHDTLRLELYSLTKNNPLATYRIKELREKFSDPKSAQANYIAHHKRVFWQLYRIYRLRNDIVHTAMGSAYTDNLILNLDTYYRAIIKSISKQLEFDNKKQLDRIFSDMFVMHEQRMYKLNNKSLSGEAFLRLIF